MVAQIGGSMGAGFAISDGIACALKKSACYGSTYRQPETLACLSPPFIGSHIPMRYFLRILGMCKYLSAPSLGDDLCIATIPEEVADQPKQARKQSLKHWCVLSVALDTKRPIT